MPLALVTGATAGLGAEFANQLAALRHDLVIVARDEARLAGNAEGLRQRYGVAVEVLPADLTTDAGTTAVAERISAGDVDVLVNNAGVATYAPFGSLELAREEALLDLNVRAMLRLTYAAVRTMTARDSGIVINVSSVAGFLPRGGNVSYSASKAWVTMFSEALSVQLSDTGVGVTTLVPGFVRTEFHQRAEVDMSHVPERMWLDAADVVRAGLTAAFAGKPFSLPSRRYQALITAARVLPKPVLRRVMHRANL